MRNVLPYVLPPVACVGLALALAALAGNPGSGQVPAGIAIVTPGDLAAVPARSPDRAVLEWWRAGQRGDAAGSYRLLAASVRADVDGRRYARELRVAVSAFSGHPRLLRSSSRGARADVRVVVEPPASPEPAPFFELRFPLVRERGRWLIASLSYLDTNVRALARVRQAAARRRAERGRPHQTGGGGR